MNRINCLNIHITNECNMRCLHCLYSSGVIKRPEIDTPSIKKLIFDFSNYCPEGTINIFGGEALIKDNIFDIFRYIKECGLSLGLTTNGKCVSRYFDQILDVGFSRISIDLDGGSSKTHDWLRNEVGHFDQSINLIKKLLSNNIDVSITTVLNTVNYSEIETVLDIGYGLGVSSHAFYMMTPLGRATTLEDYVLSGKDWLAAKEKIISWCNYRHPSYPIIWENAYRDASLGSDYYSLCSAHNITSLDISCEGDVYFCGLLTSVKKHSIGNIGINDFRQILEKINDSAINKIGCSALALSINSYKDGMLYDTRRRDGNIIPTCPYDWEILNNLS